MVPLRSTTHFVGVSAIGRRSHGLTTIRSQHPWYFEDVRNNREDQCQR